MHAQASLDGGFTEPVFGAQATFRAVMEALARPGTQHTLPAGAQPPDPLGPELGALALTLLDHDSPVFAHPALGESAREWLLFHTGAPMVDEPAGAHLALLPVGAELPRLVSFNQGTDEYPDQSTTVVLAVPALDGGPRLRLAGPGIRGEALIAPQGLPDDFLLQWSRNRERFPRGIDLLLVADGQVVGLPRTARISPWRP